jgi:hypothetical protein
MTDVKRRVDDRCQTTDGEGGWHLLAGDLLDTEADLAVGVILVLVEVAKGHLKDAALEGIARELCRLGLN